MEQLIKVIRKTPNRGKFHIFLGHPLSDGCDKTTVEPGNTYSPGVWTCGISIWVNLPQGLYTPDLMSDDEIWWGFEGEDGHPPVIVSKYKVEDSLTIEHRLTHLGAEGSEGVDFNEVKLIAESDTKACAYIVVKDVGPAGGKIENLKWDEREGVLLINETIKLYVEQLPQKCRIIDANDEFDSPVAILKYPITATKGQITYLHFKTEHGFGNRAFGQSLSKERIFSGLSVQEGFKKAEKTWNEGLSARVFAPDKRVGQVWERALFHILSAMECGLPRIGAVNYPVFWIRDGVIVLRALDLAGRHDLARIGNDYLSSLYFGGGFGAESDAPGQGIWALVSHACITGDDAWLEDVFPHVKKRVGWIDKMLNAKGPIRITTENRMPKYMNTPGVNVLCLAAQNGLIHGRMDWHSPDFYINAWSVCGLKMAAKAARKLSKEDLAEQWNSEAERLEEAIKEHLMPYFGSNDRDSIVTPYPTGVLYGNVSDCDRSLLKSMFKKWYLENRLTSDMKRNPEPLWTYFEAAQIHNAILMDLKDLAWINLDGMLGKGGNWAVSAYIEGTPGGHEFLNFRNGEERRGWLDVNRALGGNMPHNWTSAELINLIRDIFVVEEEDQLVLGKGVPEGWLEPGCSFGVKDMPTDYGIVNYTVTVDSKGSINVNYKGPKNYRWHPVIWDKLQLANRR